MKRNVEQAVNARVAQNAASELPEGHTQFWVYAHDGEFSNFAVAADLAVAKSDAREFLKEGYKNGFIYYGNESDGAFTHLDPVASFDGDGFKFY